MTIILLPDDLSHLYASGIVSTYQSNLKGMVKLKLKGDWNILKGILKQKFGNLTDDDLIFIKGKEEELVGRLQYKLGKTKQEVRDLLSRL